MQLHGLETLKISSPSGGVMSKVILNDSDGLSAVFFPAGIQHRDMKVGGLSYEDDYQGNAMAATIASGRVDIRYHRSFSDDRVREIVRRIKLAPKLAALKVCTFSYQGRSVES